ncbi:MAG: hypothetical protein GWN58_01710, partial [Anaerolineae bacterium]|nr:hypothetical protein [Anaerolineae bacterium]
WRDEANGWCPAAYKEIDDWNYSGGQVIRAMFLYRYKGDKWHIEGKNGAIEDFQNAQSFGYTWPQEPDPPDP